MKDHERAHLLRMRSQLRDLVTEVEEVHARIVERTRRASSAPPPMQVEDGDRLVLEQPTTPKPRAP